MVTVYDVPPNDLIQRTAEKLKAMGIPKPEFLLYVKSGAHAERRPQQKDFWYLRLASMLRQAYIKGRVGVNSLRTHYGGRKNRGRKKEHHYKAGGARIRRGLQMLEKYELIKKEKVGRVLTPKGRSLLDNTAYEVFKEKKAK